MGAEHRHGKSNQSVFTERECSSSTENCIYIYSHEHENYRV